MKKEVWVNNRQNLETEGQGIKYTMQAVLSISGDTEIIPLTLLEQQNGTSLEKTCTLARIRLLARSQPLQVGHGRPILLKGFPPAPKLPRLTNLINESYHISHVCHRLPTPLTGDPLFGSHLHQGTEWGKHPDGSSQASMTMLALWERVWQFLRSSQPTSSCGSPVMWVWQSSRAGSQAEGPQVCYRVLWERLCTVPKRCWAQSTGRGSQSWGRGERQNLRKANLWWKANICMGVGGWGFSEGC